MNLWGPELWSILHGVAPLCAHVPNQDVISFFSNLCTLLPCIHCKRSYNEFFSKEELLDFLSRCECMQYVYKIHSFVDDKLENQKLDQLFELISAPSEIQQQIRNNSILLSTRPTMQVVLKRWELSEDKLFPDTSVWKVLFAFVMLIDTDEEPDARRTALKSWITSLSSILQKSLEYKELASKLKKLYNFLPSFAHSTREAFTIIALARENLLHSEPSREELQKIKESERSWLKPLWSIYKHNLPAGSCGRFTCS